MMRRRFPFSLLFFFFFFQTPALIIEFTPNNTHILRDVLKEISVKQKWDLEDFRDLKLNIEKVGFGTAQIQEFRIRFSKTQLVFKFPDEVASSWKKLRSPNEASFGSFVKEASSMALLDTFKMEGPFELLVGGDDHDDLSLLLPLNSSHTGLRRILVGEGITVEVRRAQEVSLFHASDLGFQVNKSVVIDNGKIGFSPFLHSFCLPLLPIHILGSASVVAYRTQNPDAYIETTFLSKETIELLPEKCYNSHINKKQAFPIGSLSSRIAMLEKVLKSLFGDRIRQNGLLVSLKANIRASTIIRFQLEIERNIGSNETLQSMLAEWRTRPIVERVWFEVMARVEAERLKPLLIKEVKPFIGVDSAAWSSLMFNISFTKFPSILVPPEALTLDVKW